MSASRQDWPVQLWGVLMRKLITILMLTASVTTSVVAENLRPARSEPPPKIKAGPAPLPDIYVGKWCGGSSEPEADELIFDNMNPKLVGTDDRAMTASACHDTVLDIRKDGFTRDGETCRFISVRLTGRSWPRWTKPLRSDWVPEVEVVVRCSSPGLYSNKWRLNWLKGDQLRLQNL